MKTPARIRFSKQGTVLIFALLVVLSGAFVLAGWAMMLATRSLFPDSLVLSQQRRIALANGRALARQYILQNLSSNTIAATNVSYGGWGGFSTLAATVNILSSPTTPSAYNPFSAGGRDGFEQTITGNITTSDTTNAWSFRIRGRSPIYAGYPLVMHLPADSVASSVTTTNALQWTSNTATMAFTSSSYQASTNLSYLPHAGTLSPFSWVPIAMQSPAGNLSYNGTIGVTPITSGTVTVTDNATTTADGIAITSNATVQKVALNLGVVNATSINGTSSVLLCYQIDATTGNLSRNLELTGAPDDSLPPLHIVYQAGANDLTKISLLGSNQRRLYLSVIKNTAVTVTTPGSASWRLGTLLQGCSSTWTLGGTLTMTGGIRSNANIAVPTGILSLQTDAAPGGLDSLADRIVWIEENRIE